MRDNRQGKKRGGRPHSRMRLRSHARRGRTGKAAAWRLRIWGEMTGTGGSSMRQMEACLHRDSCATPRACARLTWIGRAARLWALVPPRRGEFRGCKALNNKWGARKASRFSVLMTRGAEFLWEKTFEVLSMIVNCRKMLAPGGLGKPKKEMGLRDRMHGSNRIKREVGRPHNQFRKRSGKNKGAPRKKPQGQGSRCWPIARKLSWGYLARWEARGTPYIFALTMEVLKGFISAKYREDVVGTR